MSSAVLVTGSSSGIGRAVVQRLVRVPRLTVFASARRMSSIDDLADVGAQLLELDVTDEVSMRAAVDAVEAEYGVVGILVNNAGFGAYGTIEETDLDLVRSQFETNVFGLARLTQLVCPGCGPREAVGLSISARWAAGSHFRLRATTTHPSTRWRR